jgi:arachidonate 15-lipoxygenase (second type) / 8-lipoxygenase (S-type)
MLTNYKSDLLFSMERLSTAPFSVRRVGAEESLPFAVDNAASITGLSLEELHSQGRLFISDHSDQASLPRSSQYKYGAACQAYFYIHPNSDAQFLPLAIKPNNEGSDLVYTPEDSENDWTLAKLMFNLNDIWFTQWYHLAATHITSEIVYLAAIRTLSEEHPLMSILHRRTSTETC